ncbi:hypothetical protein [Halopiger goleimassiliensis]|uniref:hypothetical protein n=1 Tax=Halopiger goleimassiliensis TaxID=1293048 RepID=UPI0012B51D08|nr:hypothetical protein [Halopiger goleimassiliensis]
MGTDTTTGGGIASGAATDTDLGLEAKIILGGAVGTIVGVLLPWVSVMGLAATPGYQSRVGQLVAVIAIVAGGLAYYRDFDKISMLVTVAAGALTSILAVLTVADGLQFAGIGIYVTVASGIALIAGGASGYRKL